MSDGLQRAEATDELADTVASIRTEPAVAATHAIRFLATEEEWNARPVQDAWRRLMAASANPSALFQTKEWFENKYKAKGEEARVAVVESDGTITGIIPFLLGEQEFYFKFCRMQCKVAHLLGGEGLTQRQEVYEPLFKAIFKNFDVDAIYFRYLHAEGPCWRAVQSSRAGFIRIHDRFKMYIVDLPQTFDAYMAERFNSSHRRTLKQRIRVLRAQGERRLWRCSACTATAECAQLRENGELLLQRISAPEEVPEFLRDGGKVAQACWQASEADWLIKDSPGWQAHLEHLAKRGFLRAYLLWCGPAPCAYALGFQGGGSYYAYSIGYDQSMAKFSPGIVMQLLMMEDLIQHDPPGKLNFGGGESEYKRRFATQAADVANVVILRRSIMGGLRAAGFTAYQSLKQLKASGKNVAEYLHLAVAGRKRTGSAGGHSHAVGSRDERGRTAKWSVRTKQDSAEVVAVSSAEEDWCR